MRMPPLKLFQVLSLLVFILTDVSMVSAFTGDTGSDNREALEQDASYLALKETQGAPPDDFLTRMKEGGVTLQLTYTGEALHSFHLIPNAKTRYRGLLDLSLHMDTEKMGLWPGGEFFAVGQYGHGKGLSVAPTGAAQPISDIDARDFTQVSQYGLRQYFLNEAIRLKVGKQDVNEIFCVNEFGEDFVYPSYTLIPTVPMPTFPAPALGAGLFVRPATSFSVGMGFFDGGPKVETLGLDTFFDGKGGYFSLLEPAWNPRFGGRGEYAGNYRMGLWYHTGDFPGTGQDPEPEIFANNYGVYFMFDQLLYRERPEAHDDQGLGAFFQLGWAPKDRNQVARYIGAGFSYKGLVPQRDRDRLGIGVSVARFTGSGAGVRRRDLMNLELFYKAELTSWMSLQPDIQYYNRPNERDKNGVAAGLRWVIQF